MSVPAVELPLAACLEDLERRIDPAVEDELLDAWQRFRRGGISTSIFRPRRPRLAPPGVVWPRVPINRCQIDRDAMLLRELGEVSAQLAQGTGLPLAVRCNYGTGILPSLFGVVPFTMPPETDTLPGTIPAGPAAIEGLIAAGVPAVTGGLVEVVFDMAAHFRRTLAPYPRITRHVFLSNPDIQGPLDILEMVWGSDYLLALIDEPSRVQELLAIITETIARFMMAWQERHPPAGVDWTIHKGWLQAGHLRICEDSAMNLPPDLIAAFVLPPTGRLLARFGGVIHACGRIDHYTSGFAGLPGYDGFNLSQPEYNDMEQVYRDTVDRGHRLYQLPVAVANAAERAGRDLHGLAQA
jgi:hypothetical protein